MATAQLYMGSYTSKLKAKRGLRLYKEGAVAINLPQPVASFKDLRWIIKTFPFARTYQVQPKWARQNYEIWCEWDF